MFKLIISIIVCSIFCTSAFSYVGPGMGGGLIAATLGVVISLLVAIFAVIWFPIKRFLKQKKQKNIEVNKIEEEENK